jgi:hypothetical protein
VYWRFTPTLFLPLLALLDEARLVDDEDRFLLITEMLDDVLAKVVSELIGVPAGSSQEVLDTIGR